MTKSWKSLTDDEKANRVKRAIEGPIKRSETPDGFLTHRERLSLANELVTGMKKRNPANSSEQAGFDVSEQ